MGTAIAKFILIWAISAPVSNGGMASGVDTRSQEFSSEAACNAAKTAILKWKDTKGFGGVNAECFPQ